MAGRSIDPEALDYAVAATRGYPFLVQLVGRHIWQVDPSQDRITLEHAQVGARGAAQRIGQLVHEPALAPLPERQRQFLAAMAVDDGPSRISDIAERVGIDGNSANQYRTRLIDAELIHPAGHGQVDYSLPYMREYLRRPLRATAGTGSGPGWAAVPAPEVEIGDTPGLSTSGPRTGPGSTPTRREERRREDRPRHTPPQGPDLRH